MKNHKDKGRFNDITSKNQQKDGSMQPNKNANQGKDDIKNKDQQQNGFMKPEKRTEQGKGSMQQPNKGSEQDQKK